MTPNECTVTKNLEVFLDDLVSKHSDQFPQRVGGGYDSRYKLISGYLRDHIHEEIPVLALLNEIKKGTITCDNAIYLNCHGKRHVDKVIECATDILSQLKCKLYPYEVYLLLTAIQFHDVGNVYGRDSHERKCMDVMNSNDLSGIIGDSIEKRYIAQIASAHGGVSRDGSKDTISELKSEKTMLSQDFRPSYLAAIVRFADELADDRTRVSRYPIDVGMIPSESRLFHEYSYSLHSVRVKGSEIVLHFELPIDKATQYFDKPDGSRTLLIDEIVSRTKKMHKERIYCMRYWPVSYRKLDSISVKIEIIDNVITGRLNSTLCDIGYKLQEDGYPGEKHEGCGFCLSTQEDIPNGEQIRKTLLGEDGDVNDDK
jgi:hypothetical protein